MNYFVVHAEHENVMEEILHQGFQVRCGLTIHVAETALFGGVRLALERGHADNGDAMGLQWGEDSGKKLPFLRFGNVFEHIQGIKRIEGSGNRAKTKIVHQQIECPRCCDPLQRVLDKDRIEVRGGQSFDFLPNDPRSQGIPAADFQNSLPTGEHFGDKFIASQSKYYMFGILSPAFAAHQTETFQSPCRHIVDTDLILSFTCLAIVDQTTPFPKKERWNPAADMGSYHAKRRKVNRNALLALPLESCLLSRKIPRLAMVAYSPSPTSGF
jgi:hypothetical protein